MPASRDTPLFRQALRSALDQDVEGLEVIVSDDSGGGLEVAIREVGDERVHHVAQPERLGFARNHTTVLDAARGEFIAMLHDDDRWLDGYLATAIRHLRAEPDLGMVCSDVWLEWEDGTFRRRRDRPAAGRYDRWLSTVMAHNVFIPSATVMRREVWDRVRREWPDVVIGDVVLWIDAARAGIPMRWVDEPLVVYRMHAGQVSADQRRHRDAGVTVFGGYAFPEDERAERLRRSRVAHYLIGRAGLRMREGQVAEARNYLAEAARISPGRQRSRRLVLSGLAGQPWLLPAAARARRIVRGQRARLDG